MLLLAAAMLAAETERAAAEETKDSKKQNKVSDQIGTITKQVQMKAVRTQSGSPFCRFTLASCSIKENYRTALWFWFCKKVKKLS